MVKSVSWPLPFGKQDGQFKLDRIFKALEILDNPQNKLRGVVHIAGTNGKGSHLAFLEKIFLHSGFSTCSYISPSLINLNERFRINSNDIDDQLLLNNLEEVRQKLAENNFENELTFFEGLTATAFYTFAKLNCDFNIIEVGLGGRFDATNVFKNKLANIITQISYDHTEYLGDTIEKIADEKIAITNKNSINLLSFQDYPTVMQVFKAKNEDGFVYGHDFSVKINEDESFIVSSKHFDDIKLSKPSLLGSHQYYNAAGSVFAAKMIAKQLNLNDKITNQNINNGIQNTFWLGRMQTVYSSQTLNIIVDGGHNEGSVKALCNFLLSQKTKYSQISLVYGALERKNVFQVAQNLASNNINSIVNGVYTTQIDSFEKCHSPEYLQQVLQSNGIQNISSLKNINDFLMQNINSSLQNKDKTLIVIFGSLYLCGQVIDFFRHQ